MLLIFNLASMLLVVSVTWLSTAKCLLVRCNLVQESRLITFIRISRKGIALVPVTGSIRKG